MLFENNILAHAASRCAEFNERAGCRGESDLPRRGPGSMIPPWTPRGQPRGVHGGIMEPGPRRGKSDSPRHPARSLNSAHLLAAWARMLFSNNILARGGFGLRTRERPASYSW